MDVTIQSGDHELSLADFLDGCAKAVNAETSTVVRSSLEDFDKKVIGNDERVEGKTFDICAPEAPEKHGILYLHIISKIHIYLHSNRYRNTNLKFKN